MSKFKPVDFKIQKDQNPHGARVVKLDMNKAPVIESFKFDKISKSGDGDYRVTKSKFGALAATDPEKKPKTQKDSRFNLSPLLREPLAVEQEERRAIEERVKERVAAISDEARKKAVEAGYRDGLKKGRDEAYEKFQLDAAARLEKLDQLLQEAENAKNEIFRANERFLIEAIYRVARMVLLRELTTDREYLSRLARELVERVGVREHIRIRINPEDSASIGMIQEGVVQRLGDLKNITVEVSKTIPRGGCSVETEWNAIDASIETQLEGVHRALIGDTGPASSNDADGAPN